MSTISLAESAFHVAFAIVLDTAALVIWNVGTRTPARVVADLRAGIRDRSAVARGCVRFAAGAVALGIAAEACLPIVTTGADFTIVESWALGAALVVEQLIGPDLRAMTGRLAKRHE